MPSCMSVIPITLIYASKKLHHLWAVLSFLWPFLWSFSFISDISSIPRIKYNKIEWNKNTAIHSTFTDVQSSDWGLWESEIFYLFISPTHCRPGCWYWDTPLIISFKPSQFSFHFHHLQEVSSLLYSCCHVLSLPIISLHFSFPL